MGGRSERKVVSTGALPERDALERRVRDAQVERVLVALRAEGLSPEEDRVLRVMTVSAIEGRRPKAWELAADTNLTLRQLEQACDRLLERGLIGPGIVQARRLH